MRLKHTYSVNRISVYDPIYVQLSMGVELYVFKMNVCERRKTNENFMNTHSDQWIDVVRMDIGFIVNVLHVYARNILTAH